MTSVSSETSDASFEDSSPRSLLAHAFNNGTSEDVPIKWVYVGEQDTTPTIEEMRQIYFREDVRDQDTEGLIEHPDGLPAKAEVEDAAYVRGTRETMKCCVKKTFPWVVVFVLGMLSLFLMQTVNIALTPVSNRTDIAYLKSFIKLEQTRFNGAIRATADGNAMHIPEPALDSQCRPFVGPPSPAIDAAWFDLIFGRYVIFNNEEVEWLNGDDGVPALTPINYTTSHIPQQGYYGGPDMLHSLHCLNGLRKHLDIEYYKDEMSVPEEYRRMHIEHCIEQLRQAVLCHADLTPVTLKPVRNSKGEVVALLGETERMHTCRNGVMLAKKWQERGAETARVEYE
ncbi:hypothetical protein BAUCODRAFT_393946 [Baudoinia panamericana UAMH 10762]|uniref:Uncharacterized protein n=1 Tax=Baudoinia panamericana (strain UAMH 10762) TaxID=717646 RepID=M2MQS5_BAUPA|nr:uncharacterized protein BAUCODRAFT_393946 [Baudoinia panamericana UAMH 10762]EMC99166.1 hypothetical protein BAUCODRAFT_393946 [Baudoinia panamericana UAMH 10762]